jgi:signal transduction histidine kinase
MTAARLIREKRHLLPKNSPVPNRRILVIDDESEIGEGIRRTLTGGAEPSPAAKSTRSSRNAAPQTVVQKPQEFDVVVVQTPEQAVEAVTDSLRNNQPFAMGCFDVGLNADIDGIELVKQILSVDSKMFAVFVTAYHDRNVDSIGSFLGEENREKWDYINKPFTEGEILQKARNATSLWDLHRLKEWQEERLSEAHQLLLQNEKQNAVAAVGRSVAHEFGNLLTHIIGNAELALENGEASEMKNALDVVLKAADTASNILYRFRELNGGAQKTQSKQKFDVWGALEEANELLEFQFRKRYIRVVKKNVQSVEISALRHSLVQVFVNLFINSIHAMPDGGELRLYVEAKKSAVQIRVVDTGPGIPEDILPRVTEPLFTTKGKMGSGLGLAICKEIVEIEHRGEFVIQNHAKGGLEVSITLPESEDK